MLRLEGASVEYGPIRAIDEVSIEVSEGQVVALMGPNGAGKSSLLASISGLAQVSRGTVTLEGQDITGLSVERRAKMGISTVLEGRRIFRDLTVEENLQLAGNFRLKATRREKSQVVEEIYSQFPLLKERQREKAAKLSGGQLQLLIFAVATAARPKLLLLDEPSLGLAPLMVKEIYEVVKNLNEQGVTIILAEQLAPLALQTASYAYILNQGAVAMEGTAKSLKGELDEKGLASTYLGGGKK